MHLIIEIINEIANQHIIRQIPKLVCLQIRLIYLHCSLLLIQRKLGQVFSIVFCTNIVEHCDVLKFKRLQRSIRFLCLS